MGTTGTKLVKAPGVQAGPSGPSKEQNVEAVIAAIRDAVRDDAPDLVVTPELGTTPYFCGTGEKQYRDWAEPIPGPTTDAFGGLARELGTNMVVGMFERVGGRGEYYNSAVVINRKGEIERGGVPEGPAVRAYRETHVADLYQ